MALTKSDLSAIKSVVGTEVKAETLPIKKNLRRIEKKLDYSINFMDKDYVNLKKYTIKIAEEVGIPAPSF